MENEEAGDRRRFQTVSSNVQNIHPRSAEADHPRQRWTIGVRFAPLSLGLLPLSFILRVTPASGGQYRHIGEGRYPEYNARQG